MKMCLSGSCTASAAIVILGILTVKGIAQDFNIGMSIELIKNILMETQTRLSFTLYLHSLHNVQYFSVTVGRSAIS